MELSNRSKEKIKMIVSGARSQFIQYGFKKTTIDGISAYTGVSKVTIYKYFESKQVLYEHILKETYRQEFDTVESIINSDMGFKEKIDKIIEARLHKYDNDTILKIEPGYMISDDLIKFNQENTKRMAELNHKLYAQGKQEQLIRSDLTDEILDLYFKVIRTGLRGNFGVLSKFGKDNLTLLLQILYAGVLGCNGPQTKEKE